MNEGDTKRGPFIFHSAIQNTQAVIILLAQYEKGGDKFDERNLLHV